MGNPSLHDRHRVGINAHLLSGQDGYRRAGIHHYIAGLLNNLPGEGSGFHFSIFANNKSDLHPAIQSRIVATPWPTGMPLVRIAWEQLVWPLAAARHKIDLLHGLGFVTPLFSRRPAVVTVYDLSFIHYPERFPTLKRAYLTNQTRRSCQAARRVVTISEASREDLVSLFGLLRDKVDIVRPGVDKAFQILPAAEMEAFLRREELTPPFFLHVGTLQPRKNLTVLIEALARLKRPDVTLALVGGKGWYYQELYTRVRDFGLEKQVRFCGYVPDATLPRWYNAAAAMVFPSLYEGFGLPVIQAMACGTPVIASNASAIPEVTGPAARLFDPEDVGSLADHMAAVLDEAEVKVTMREAGLLQAARFSWKQAGLDMIEVYKRALAEA